MNRPSRQTGTTAMSNDELSAMALVLEGRHGCLAADVAEFFSSTHLQNSDRRRGVAWARVADIVRERESQRLGEAFRFGAE
jgi:hypothetical protein